MAFKAITGGFELSAEDKKVLNKQRSITKEINDSFIQVGAIFLKASSKNPFERDGWATKQHKDTDLQTWIDDESMQHSNVGFNLQFGWMDVDIDAEDPEFNSCVVSAMEHLKIDTRFRFGRQSVGYPTHVMVQLGEEEAKLYSMLARFEPQAFKIDGKRYHVQLRSMSMGKDAEKTAKQTVMPGSIYHHKSEEGQYDLSVWYTGNKTATDVKSVAATTPRRVNFNEVVRAITFATFLYVVRDEWVEGNRQVAAQKLCGWLARVVSESAAINNNEVMASDVYCPVDDDDIAIRLIEYICQEQNDEEVGMRKRAYYDARDKLDRNPDAKIPGWPTLAEMLGGEKTAAIRTVFMPGSDVSELSKMAERYLYDESDNLYIDRERFFTSGNFAHEATHIERRHKGDIVKTGGKPKEVFRIFESSDMRKRVGGRDLYPELEPGGVYRITSMGEVLRDEDEDDPSALTIFNTWRGWPVAVPEVVDEELMNDCVAKLDVVLGYLTRDNPKQIDWIKKWIAWTFQHPGDKQQIAWIVVGEQGIGKSWIGNIFMKALMGGGLWGSAAPKILEGDFTVGPFINKMFTFIDEAKFHSEQGTDEIKKLIRGVDVAGQEKFQDGRNYRLFSRIMFASNRLDMNIGQTNVRDRALFYTRAYDRDYKKLTEPEFRAWAETLKPFFTDFTAMLNRREVREHFMHYFMNYPTDKYEVESIEHSSSGDEQIVASNMGWARRVAKFMIEEGRVHEDLDITHPFTKAEFHHRVGEVSKEMGFRNLQGDRVLAEYDGAGIIERVKVEGRNKYRFTHKLGDLTKLFGDAISVPLDPQFEFTEDDYGLNENDGSELILWRGRTTRIQM